MQAWVALVTETLEAEFPGFSLMFAMSIFNLNTNSRKAEVDQEGMIQLQQSAKRLCSVFPDVDERAFIDEYLDLRPIAMHHGKLASVSSFECWREAIRKVSRRSSAPHPTRNLAKLIVRLGAWDGSTTSNTERVFARLRKCERCLSDQNRRLELKMLWDHERLGAEVHTMAVQVWEQLFGVPRNGCTTRMDKGVKRKRSASWLRFMIKLFGFCFQSWATMWSTGLFTHDVSIIR